MKFFQLGLSMVLQKLFKFFNLFFVYIKILGGPCLSNNSLTFNKAEGCLNDLVTQHQCFQELIYMTACCFDQLSCFAKFLTSSLFFLRINQRTTVATICRCVTRNFSGQWIFSGIRALRSTFHLQHKKESICRKRFSRVFPPTKT